MGSITEKDLIKLGFEKIIVKNEESQNGFDYYYYIKEVCKNVLLHSTDSKDVKNDNWELKCYEIPSIKISNIYNFNQFIEVLNNIIC